MLEAGEEAIEFSQTRSRANFLAVVKSIEIIGEAASKVSPEFRAATAGIPWPELIGIRNRLVHAYFDMNIEVIWKAVDEDLPSLIQRLRAILNAPPAP